MCMYVYKYIYIAQYECIHWSAWPYYFCLLRRWFASSKVGGSINWDAQLKHYKWLMLGLEYSAAESNNQGKQRRQGVNKIATLWHLSRRELPRSILYSDTFWLESGSRWSVRSIANCLKDHNHSTRKDKVSWTHGFGFARSSNQIMQENAISPSRTVSYAHASHPPTVSCSFTFPYLNIYAQFTK